MAAVTFICMPIAGIIVLSVVWLYCLNEGLRFTMLCSHGVWRAVIISYQFPKVIAIFAWLYAGFFGGGGSIARNPFSRQLYAQPEVAPKFWELVTWKLSWVEDYRQSNTTSEA